MPGFRPQCICTSEAKSRIGGAPRLQDAVADDKDEQKENALEIHRHGKNPRIESLSCAGELPTVDLLGI
jgi:hypothetical protein